MVRSVLLFLAFSAASLVYAQHPTAGQQSAEARKHYRTVCYYQSWARYRPDPVTFHPEDVDTSLCTHLIYAFANLDASGQHIIPFDDSDLQMYKRLTDLKREKHNLKVMLAVGGWTVGTEEFHAMVSSEGSMHAFAGAAIEFLHLHNFDGLDVDWEYPGLRGSPPEDKQKFTRLLQILHQRINMDHRLTNRTKLLLSAVVSVDQYHLTHSFELPDIAEPVDFLNLLAYDMHGSWDTTLGHHSALYPTTEDPSDSLDYALKWLLNTTVPAAKLNLGLPLYGRSVGLVDPTNTDVGAPINGTGGQGVYTREEGIMAYYEICKLLTENPDSVTSGHVSGTSAPYIIDGNRWTGYDDEESIREKVSWVVDHDLGGVMVWGIDLDDFHGICGQGHYPLMHAIRNQLQSGLIG